MLSVYNIQNYIKMIKNKRRHFYYLNSKGDLFKGYVKRALIMVNRILNLLRSYNYKDQIIINAYGGYVIYNYRDLTLEASGAFNSDYLDGLQ